MPLMNTFECRIQNLKDFAMWQDIEKYIKLNNSVNFGPGKSDFMPPECITSALESISKSRADPSLHQYARSWGHPRLVNVLAKMYGDELNRELDPMKEILVTAGGVHALFCCFQALLKPGDEVIFFQPAYDLYDYLVKKYGYVPVNVNLTIPKTFKTTPLKFANGNCDPENNSESKDNSKTFTDKCNLSTCSDTENDEIMCASAAEFTFDEEVLASKFSEKTKLLVLNTPHNPLGKVFNMRELKIISELCIKHDVLVISDEVYERLIHPPNKHISIASLPGMWDRTIKIGSAGKTLSVTGWKIGWCVGPNELIEKVVEIHGLSIYTCASVLQEAIAIALEQEYKMKSMENSYFNSLSQSVMEKLKKVCHMVSKAGMVPIMPEGGYFITADISNVDFKLEDENENKDVQFAIWLLKEKNIAVLPLSIFYDEQSVKVCPNLIRICCFKSDETLSRAQEIFEKW